jgi:hypothetical protein
MALMALEIPSLSMLMVARSHRLRMLEMARILESEGAFAFAFAFAFAAWSALVVARGGWLHMWW